MTKLGRLDSVIHDIMRENDLHLTDYKIITMDGKRGVKINGQKHCFLHIKKCERSESDIDNFSKAMRRVMMDMRQEGKML